MTQPDFKQLTNSIFQAPSAEPFSVARLAFQRLSGPLQLDVYFNYLVVNDDHRMWLSSYHGIPYEAAQEIQFLDFGHAVCGTVAQTRTAMHVEDVQRSNNEKTSLIRMFGVRAYTCFPLLTGDRLLGTLSFGSRTKTKFTQQEHELLGLVANRVAEFIGPIVMPLAST